MSTAPRNNKVALQPMHPMENKAIRYVPIIEPRTANPNIGMKSRLGLCELAWCKVCKAELEVDYSVGGMRTRFMAFLDEHEDCKPIERGNE